jgi:hypothetical protein
MAHLGGEIHPFRSRCLFSASLVLAGFLLVAFSNSDEMLIRLGALIAILGAVMLLGATWLLLRQPAAKTSIRRWQISQRRSSRGRPGAHSVASGRR